MITSDTFEPVLLEAAGIDDGHTIESYRSRGGYAPLEKLLSEKQPPEVVEMVKSSGLRGRGGAGFMTGLKWTFLPKDHPGPIYLCVNADESEPGTFNNRILMEDDPHQVLEGTIISAYATHAIVSMLFTTVGLRNTPSIAGKGGFIRGHARLPSRLSIRPVSSPQIYAAAPRWR